MDLITFPENLLTTSGLSILLHGDISVQDATSYNKLNHLILSSEINAYRKQIKVISIASEMI